MSTKKYVFASTISLVDTKDIRIDKAIVEALFARQPLTSSILNEVTNGIGANMASAYKYAGAGQYPFGLPTTTISHKKLDQTALVNMLSAIEGSPVTVHYGELDLGYMEFFAEYWLYQNRGYNFFDKRINELSVFHEVQTDSTYSLWIDSVTSSKDTQQAALTLAANSSITNNEPYTLDGVPVTKYIKTTTVASSVKSIDFSRTLSTHLASMEPDVIAASNAGNPSYNYFVDYQYETTMACTAVATIVITKKITQEIWYKYANNDITASTFVNLPDEIITNSEVINNTFNFPFSEQASLNVVENRLHVMAKYSYGTGLNQVAKMFLYDTTTNTYPSLITVSFGNPFYKGLGNTYPVVPLRRNNIDLVRNTPDNQLNYTTTKELLSKLSIKVEDVADAINSNEDLDEIDHAYLHMGVSIDTKTTAGNYYLVKFFTKMYYESDTQHLPPINRMELFSTKNYRVFAVNIAGWSIEIRWKNILITDHPGSIGKVGTIKKTLTNKQVKFQHQVAKRSYREIIVVEPTQHNFIHERMAVVTDLEDVLDAEKNTDPMVIPLMVNIMDETSMMYREHIFYESIFLTFNSFKRVKLKWYETDAFKAVLTIIAVVVFIYTGYDFYHGFLVTLEQQGFLYAVGQLIIQAIILQVEVAVFKQIVTWIGADAALILAVVLVAYGVLSPEKLSDVTISGVNLVHLVNGLVTGIESNLRSDIMDLRKKEEAYKLARTKEQEELDRRWKLLETSDLVDPFQFMASKPLHSFNETPEQYFQRTIHTGNIGAYVFDVAENYHSMALTLPKPNFS